MYCQGKLRAAACVEVSTVNSFGYIAIGGLQGSRLRASGRAGSKTEGVCYLHFFGEQMIRSYKGKSPVIANGCYVDESAQLIGDVTLGENSSVWMNAVLRG